MSPLGRSLLAVNVVLLAALFVFQLESPARGGAVNPRPRGSYLMVTSTMEAGNSWVPTITAAILSSPEVN